MSTDKVTYRAIWPIVVVRPMQRLIDEACEELPRMARFAGVQITGTPAWSIHPSIDIPGSGRVSDFCLVVTVQAEPIDRTDPEEPPNPRRKYANGKHAAQLETIEELLAQGHDKYAIAERIRIHKTTVERYIAEINRRKDQAA